MSWSNGRLKGLSTRLRKDFNFRRVQETVPALRWLKPKSGERILDIGCGEGAYNYRIALRGAQIFGFDLDRRQLRRAMALHKTPSTEFICADATMLPMHSGQFDTVMSLCVFEHLPDDRETLREISRVLRPDGRILLTLDSLSLKGVDESVQLIPLCLCLWQSAKQQLVWHWMRVHQPHAFPALSYHHHL